MVIKKGVCVFGILVLMIFMIGVVSATNLYIQPTGNDGNDCTLGSACATIQRGIGAASSGDIIIVNAGKYNETLLINKTSLTLRSSGGEDVTFINGSITVNSSGFTLGGANGQGFTLNSYNNSLATDVNVITLINLTNGTNNIEISHNILNTTAYNKNVSVGYGRAILMNGNASIENITIYNNTFYLGNVSDKGIVSHELINISGLNITQNFFNKEGGVSYSTAIAITVPDISSIASYIYKNTIKNAAQGIIIGNNTDNYGLLSGSSYLEIKNNTFYENNISIDIVSVQVPTMNSTQNITIIENNFTDSRFVAIAINASSFSTTNTVDHVHGDNFTIRDNLFVNNTLGINNSGGVLYVIKAENNYWNAGTGPGGVYAGSNSSTGGGGIGAGDNVSRYVDYSPWYESVNLSLGRSINIQVRNISSYADYYFANISDALNSANKGDIIEVGDGWYHTDVGNITVNKEVSIIGNGTGQANFTFPAGFYGFNITADNVAIKNLNITLTNPAAVNYSASGYYRISAINVLKGNNITIDNMIITTVGNKSIAIKGGWGNYTNSTIYTDSNYTKIANLTITNNVIRITDKATGILSIPANSTHVHSEWNISRNTIIANKGIAIELYDLNNSEISYNNLSVNRSVSLGNFIWGSVYQNLSELIFSNNILNGTRNDTNYGIVFFKNVTDTTLAQVNVTSNTIRNWGNGSGVWLQGGIVSSTNDVRVNENNFSDDDYTIGYAVRNDGTSNINATFNYWGNVTGPGANSTNGGGEISTNVLYWRYYNNSAMTTLSAVAVAAATTTTTSSSSSGGTAVVKTWTKTYIAGAEEIESEGGYSREFAAKHRVKFKIEDEDHQVGVKELTDSTATIQVSSEVQEATLVIGDIRKFDVTDDGFYDLSIVLNKIEKQKADMTIKSIHEEITKETKEEEKAREEEAEKLKEVEESAEQKRIWIWIIIGIIVVLVLIGVGYGVKKKR